MAAHGGAPGVCLIGCGSWGAIHALGMQALGGRVRRYYSSRTLAHAAQFAQRFSGDGTFESAQAAIQDANVSAVIIATPHDTHAPLARAALAAGKHVLVEKPFAVTTADAVALVGLAQEHDVCLAVAEEYRLSPLIGAARGVLESGRLGRILFARASAVTRFQPAEAWKRDPVAAGGGVLLDVGIHYVDLLRYLVGEPVNVFAHAPGGADGAELTAAAMLSFGSGTVAHLTITWEGRRGPDEPNLELIGEHGGLRVDFRRPRVEEWTALPSSHWSRRLRAALPWRVRERLAGLISGLPQAKTRHHRVPARDLIGSHALVADFVGAFIERRSPAADGRDGARDLAVVRAAYESMRTGRQTTVPALFAREGGGAAAATRAPGGGSGRSP